MARGYCDRSFHGAARSPTMIRCLAGGSCTRQAGTRASPVEEPPALAYGQGQHSLPLAQRLERLLQGIGEHVHRYSDARPQEGGGADVEWVWMVAEDDHHVGIAHRGGIAPGERPEENHR